MTFYSVSRIVSLFCFVFSCRKTSDVSPNLHARHAGRDFWRVSIGAVACPVLQPSLHTQVLGHCVPVRMIAHQAAALEVEGGTTSVEPNLRFHFI